MSAPLLCIAFAKLVVPRMIEDMFNIHAIILELDEGYQAGEGGQSIA